MDDPIDLPPSLQAGTVGEDLLSTYWPSVIAGAGAAALVALLLWRRRVNRRSDRTTRRSTTVATCGGAVTLTVVGVLFGVNTWVGYIPSLQAAERWLRPVPAEPLDVVSPMATESAHPEGERRTTATSGYAFPVTIPSTSAKAPEAKAWVYVPPDYDRPGNATRYPVVYALHGAPGTGTDWFAAGRIDHTLDELITTDHLPPTIVVTPDVNARETPVDTEPLNLPGGPQIESFIQKDVVAWADANLRTRADAHHRIIAGMSAGGFAALVCGLHQPEVFGGVIALLPYDAPYTESIVADPSAREHNTPASIIKKRAGSSGQPVFMALGASESQRPSRNVLRALRGAGQPATLRIFEGLDHNWVAARAMMPSGLVWTAGQMGWTSDDG